MGKANKQRSNVEIGCCFGGYNYFGKNTRRFVFHSDLYFHPLFLLLLSLTDSVDVA